jgi:hypothetical protein
MMVVMTVMAVALHLIQTIKEATLRCQMELSDNSHWPRRKPAPNIVAPLIRRRNHSS